MLRPSPLLRVALASCAALLLVWIAVTHWQPAEASVFTVDRVTDEPDADTSDGVCDVDLMTGDLECSLRAAIQQANAGGGSDSIRFSAGVGVVTIAPGSELPPITAPVSVDGTTQPGFAGKPIVVVDGVDAGGGASGITVSSLNVTVRGLVVQRFGVAGIEVTAGGRATIVGNFAGTDAGGGAAMPNGAGILLQNSGSKVGGTVAADRNIISGNTTYGVHIQGQPASGNHVIGNYIGTDFSGFGGLGNGVDGVRVTRGAQNIIGGPQPGERNVVSGNGMAGVMLFAEVFNGAEGNVVQGNLVGTNATGTAAIGNGAAGIHVFSSANVIGGTTEGAGNVASGSGGPGIELGGLAPAVIDIDSNVLQGNLVGTDVSGTSALPNATFGVFFNGLDNLVLNNMLGGEEPGAGNVISGNGLHGISVTGAGADDNVIQGNWVGVTKAGAPLGNTGDGVFIFGSTQEGTTLGGSEDGANVIARNGGNGVAMASGTRNEVTYNEIVDNGFLGIDLGNDGKTANDVGDGDGGANFRQNYPGIEGIEGALVTGTLMTSEGSFTLHFYQNVACDGSGAGEGQEFLDSDVVATDDTGVAKFTAGVSGMTPGRYLTATATDGEGNTSEFSGCVLIPEKPPTPTPTPVPTATPEPTPTGTPTTTPEPTDTPSPTPSGPPLAQGDSDCDKDVDTVDALALLVFTAGLPPLEREKDCPAVGALERAGVSGALSTATPTRPPPTPTATQGAPTPVPGLFGDTDCDGDIDSVDALAILRFVAGLEALPQQEPCADVGTALSG